MSGHLLGDRPQGEDNPGNNRRILSGLQDRLGVRLTHEKLKMMYENLERGGVVEGTRPFAERVPLHG